MTLLFIIVIEKTKKYNGYYHVLDGLISPIEGINPEDLKPKKEEKKCNPLVIALAIIGAIAAIAGIAYAVYYFLIPEDSGRNSNAPIPLLPIKERISSSPSSR